MRQKSPGAVVAISNLQQRFQTRLLAGLHTNTVLRGAWAEELAAHYLGDCRFPDKSSYFDLDWEGTKVSVKHSVGSAARFAVPRTAYAWEPDGTTPGGGAFLGTGPDSRRYWCDLYLFAWLDLGHKVRVPSLDQVLDPAAWGFAALSRAQMEERFHPETQSVGRSVLAEYAPFVPGPELAAAARRQLGLA